MKLSWQSGDPKESLVNDGLNVSRLTTEMALVHWASLKRWCLYSVLVIHLTNINRESRNFKYFYLDLEALDCGYIDIHSPNRPLLFI